jgi:NADH-quinone oxidoreductase subunit M
MILELLIGIPLIAAVACLLVGSDQEYWPRWISLAALGVDLVLLIWISAGYWSLSGEHDLWIIGSNRQWIPQLGISLRFGMDGLSLLMVLLTVILGMASIVCSWKEITHRVGFFHFHLMAVLGGIIGVFLSLDLFVFYFFWELMLIPMYFLISIWGHENRRYAAIKFFLFTQAGGLLMLAGIVALFFVHGNATGEYTFNYFELLKVPVSGLAGLLIMLAFVAGFAVKLPAVPIHTWLPDAHTEAPTAGSVILAGLLLKTGAYGLIRFVLPLFSAAVVTVSTTINIVAVAGILYGAVLAFGQNDMKRMVAYTSVSHMGFVLLGIFGQSTLALQGAVMQMICHGISTGALFLIVGMIQERTHTRDMNELGGLWTLAPRMGGVAMVFALASLGLPGLGNFVGEFLVLVGAYGKFTWLVVFATIGLVVATVYAVDLMRRVFFGPAAQALKFVDLSLREAALMAPLVVLIVILGLYPQPVFKAVRPTIDSIANRTALHLTWEPSSSSSGQKPGEGKAATVASQGIRGRMP